MSNSNSGTNVVYVDHDGTSSRFGNPGSTAAPDTRYVDFAKKIRYSPPGMEPAAPAIVAPSNWLQVALAEADRKYGNMLRRLAE